MSIWTNMSAAAARLFGPPMRPDGDGRPGVVDEAKLVAALVALGAKMAKADGQVRVEDVQAFRQVFKADAQTEQVIGRFFDLARFTGLATEEGLTLPLVTDNLDLAGLLLGGAVLGTLGALDDVTVTQVATVNELRFRRPDLTRRQLVVSGIRVGREHIASTVNTLLLAYAGASMPLLLLFSTTDQSLGIVANSELVAVEIVRTLTGSIGLVAAVPITTALAAAVISRPDRQDPPQRPTSATDTTNATDLADDPAPETQWSDFGPTDDAAW